MTTRYFIKCDDCKADIDETDVLAKSVAGGRCVLCKGFTPGRIVWVKYPNSKNWREAVILFARAHDPVLTIRPKSYKCKGSERWHHSFVHLEKPS